MTAMPGETLSCVGCHDRANNTPLLKPTIAQLRRPSTIEPWYGPTRGFSFRSRGPARAGSLLRGLPQRKKGSELFSRPRGRCVVAGGKPVPPRKIVLTPF